MFHKKSPPLREHKTAKAFTPNAMSICNLQPAGEEVKAKNEKQLTRTRAQRAQRESLHSVRFDHRQAEPSPARCLKNNGTLDRRFPVFSTSPPCFCVPLRSATADRAEKVNYGLPLDEIGQKQRQNQSWKQKARFHRSCIAQTRKRRSEKISSFARVCR